MTPSSGRRGGLLAARDPRVPGSAQPGPRQRPRGSPPAGGAAADCDGSPPSAVRTVPGVVQARARGDGLVGVPSVAGVRASLGPGQPLPRHSAERFSAAYRHDLSGVRVHPDNELVAGRGAAAVTVGSDIAVAPGLYRPGTAAGEELLGHELAHVVQQRGGSSESAQASGLSRSGSEAEADRAARAALDGRPVPPLGRAPSPVQLRELGPAEDPATAGPGDWTFGDRLTNSPRWQAACRHNLLHLRSGEYIQIAERAAFYWWFYDEVAARGYETRWPLAAAVVASGANELANRDPAGIDVMRTNAVEGLLRRGNQVIFDDVLPKLRDLYLGPVLTGADALAWDSRVLIEEQNLIQPIYASLDPADIATVEAAARQEGVLATAGTAVFGRQAAGRHNVGGTPPPFPATLDIRVPEDRWRYGMMLAHYFAVGSAQDAAASLAWAMSLTAPPPGVDYTSGARLAEVDRFRNLHHVTSLISSARMDVDEVRRAIHGLSPAERDVLARDEWHVAMLRHRHGMTRAQAQALLTSEDVRGCSLLRVVGHVEGTGTYTEADGIVVVLRPGQSWTTRGGTRRVQVQAVSQSAYAAFTGVPLRWVWEDSLRCYRSRPDPQPVPPPVVTSYPVLYDTGSAELESDSHAATNVATLNSLLERVRTLRGEPGVDRIELEVVGQASPRWEGERDQLAKAARNLDLSRRRASDVEAYLRAAYARFGGPVPVVVVGPIAGGPTPLLGPAVADEVTRTGLGSLPGLLRTWDSRDDDQRFRRADVVLRVTFRRP